MSEYSVRKILDFFLQKNKLIPAIIVNSKKIENSIAV